MSPLANLVLINMMYSLIVEVSVVIMQVCVRVTIGYVKVNTTFLALSVKHTVYKEYTWV